MVDSSLRSRAGTQYHKPIVSLALMAGAGRRLGAAACSARENRGAFLALYTAKVRITVEADGMKIIREGHGSGEARANSPGEVQRTSHSRRRRPMPPSAPWPRLANHSGLSSIGRTRRACSNTHPHCSQPLQIHHHSRVSVYIPTTRHQFLGRRITMGAEHLGSMTELLRQDQARGGEAQLQRLGLIALIGA